jgi:hypothetical protein
MLSLAKDLSELHIAPYKEPMGELIILNQVEGLGLAWQNTTGEWAALAPQATGGRVKVPVGAHYLWTCSVSTKDKQGNTIGGAGYIRKPMNPLKVEASQTVALVCGPPLVVDMLATRNDGGAMPGKPPVPPHLQLGVKITGVGRGLLRTAACEVHQGRRTDRHSHRVQDL